MLDPNDDQMNRRVIVIDDNEAIHADFRKILTPTSCVGAELLAAEADLFGDPTPVSEVARFELATASQGAEGYEMIRRAAEAGQPFAMAFVDMRMPPGWDGIETIARIWRDFPRVEMVICTAFSDYSWDETVRRLGRTDRLLIVKKPFDHVEVLQVASALTHKWNLQLQASQRFEDLGRLVSERTQELERARDEMVALNGELIVARDAAQAANWSKTMFLANISHELRTPMTAIVGYADELHDAIATSPALTDASEALDTIRRNAKHLVGIIGDLLDVAKLEAGRVTVECIECQALHIVRDVVDLLRPRATARGLQLLVEYEGALPLTIQCDPMRLRQILINLVDNAIKFTAAGSVSISIGLVAGAEPESEARMRFSVRDTGMGMADEVLRRLFRPFEQADVSTTRRFGGTGLGLSLSRQLARLLGGDITAESQPGVGSCFRAEIPTGSLAGCGWVARPEGLRTLPSEAPAREGVATDCRARVLLVEDGLDNRRLITSILQRAGCEVEVVGNGQECLDRFEAPENSFDVVVMDVQMPVMDGLTATRHLRHRGSHVPIIALTASASQDDEDDCLRAGCDAFLTKPIDRGRLVHTVVEFASRREPSD